jgi:Zn-dependent protease with chaperone function
MTNPRGAFALRGTARLVAHSRACPAAHFGAGLVARFGGCVFGPFGAYVLASFGAYLVARFGAYLLFRLLLRLLAVGALAALLGACATRGGDSPGGPGVTLWKASELAEFQGGMVPLRDKNERTVATVSRERIREISAVKRRIEKAAGVGEAELVVASGAEPNAFAADTAKGRVVAINIAMINLLGADRDAYAAVIGHEYAHLALRHGEARKSREQLRYGASNVLGVVLSAVGVPFGGLVASFATTAVTRTYSRDEEREADRLGFDYLTRAGYQPAGAVRVWEKMSAFSQASGVPFLATHPPSEERLLYLKELAGKRPLPAAPSMPSLMPSLVPSSVPSSVQRSPRP